MRQFLNRLSSKRKMDFSLSTSLTRIAIFYVGLFVFYQMCHSIDWIQSFFRRRAKRA